PAYRAAAHGDHSGGYRAESGGPADGLHLPYPLSARTPDRRRCGRHSHALHGAGAGAPPARREPGDLPFRRAGGKRRLKRPASTFVFQEHFMTIGKRSAEIVIIGGGIYGTSLAYEFARKGRDVLLLEAGDIASGASGGPGERGVRANGRDIRELPVVALSFARWQDRKSTRLNSSHVKI